MNRYQISEAFKENCKANIGLNRYGRIHVVEDNIDIVGENYNGQLVDFTIEDNCYVKDTFVGTTVAKKITVNILNPDNSINLENKTVKAYVGIYIDGKLEEIPYGTYIIEKPSNEEVKQKTSFTGYDYMIKFNIPYKDRVKYPIKASALFEDICNQVGLKAGNLNFTNADYMILGNPFTNNEDCRTVLSNIAQLAGTFAKIGRDNKVYIPTLKNTLNLLTVKYVNAVTVKELNLTEVKVLSGEGDNADEILDGNNYFEDFSKNDQWGGLNSLVLAVSDIEGENTALDDKADIQEHGLIEITIQDNYFLINQEEREKAIVPLWNMLKGLKYLPFKTEYYGYPYLDVGDMIYIQDTKDNGYISYVFNHSFMFNGSFKGSLETPALTKAQTAYKNTFDIKTKFRNAERSIDKINGVIKDIIEEQSETTQKLSEHEQTIDGFRDTVSNIETNLNENYSTTEQMQSLIEQKADNIELSVSKKVDNIQVGGTNLLPNSAPYTLNHWIRLDASQVEISLEDEETAPFKKCVRMRLLEKPTGNMGVYIVPTSKTLKQGQEYSFSVWLKSTANTNNLTVGYLKGGQKAVNITTEWQKVTHTFIADAPTSETHGFVIYAPAGTTSGRSVYIHSAKLEEGNKATAWSPAPEDDVKGHEIISKINMSSEDVTIQSKKISLEGYTTINKGFSIDEKGNASIANGNVIIDDEGIKLAEGTSIVNANGLYTNLQFISGGLYGSTYGGQYSLLGIRRIYDYDTGITFGTDDLLIDVFIPSNFVINKAVLTLMHSAEDWSGYDDITSKDYNCVGYARNIKLYRTTSNYKMQFTMGGDLVVVGLDGLSEISNAFGTNGYTCGTNYRTAGIVERKDSIDISSSLKSGYQKLVLRTTQTANNVADAAAKTALAYAILNVYGYLNKI